MEEEAAMSFNSLIQQTPTEGLLCDNIHARIILPKELAYLFYHRWFHSILSYYDKILQ